MSEFDDKLRIIDCSKHDCDLWKFNAQAPCLLKGKCLYEKEDDKP